MSREVMLQRSTGTGEMEPTEMQPTKAILEWSPQCDNNDEACGPPELVRSASAVGSSVETRQLGNGSGSTCVQIKHHVPSHVQGLLWGLRSDQWTTKSTAAYRRCSSLHFGLGLARFTKPKLGRGSRDFPAIQAIILKHLTSIQPQSCFSSFIVNRYEVGDQMGRHSDHNMSGQSMQLVLIWGDFRGGDLVVYNKDGTRMHTAVGPTTLLMDGNANHEVTPVTSGVRYSIVTYAKNTFAKCDEDVREELRQCGFPLPTLEASRSISVPPGSSTDPRSISGHGEYERDLAVKLLDHVENQCKCRSSMDIGTLEGSVFLDRMRTFRGSGLFCDLLLQAGDAREPCHQCIVAATSESLHNFLVESIKVEPREHALTFLISVDNLVSATALGIVVDHIYGVDVRGRLRQESPQALIEVFNLAVGWGLFPLLWQYKEIMKERVPQFDATILRDILRGVFVIPTCRLREKISHWRLECHVCLLDFLWPWRQHIPNVMSLGRPMRKKCRTSM